MNVDPPKAAKPPPELQPSVLERWGVGYFRTLSRDVSIDDTDGVHFLNAEERQTLRTIVRGAVLRAANAGAISTLISASAEVLALPLMKGPGVGSPLRFWGIVVGATALASIIEIAYLYWDGLRAVHRMAVVAGLDLFGQPVDPGADPSREERTAVASALSRAALELPNPVGRVFGVNPRRDASRWSLGFASLVYKAKISVTNFLVKALVRRALGRTVVRGSLDVLVPFAAVPVTAAWNGIVAWLVLREARLRTMGPSAAGELTRLVLEGTSLSSEARLVVLRAVASSIVRTQDLHPNLVALLECVAQRLEVTAPDDLDDPALFVPSLQRLDTSERRIVLRMLCVAAIIDGRISRKERLLVTEAFRTCGFDTNFGPLHALRRGFVRGDRLDVAMIESLA